MRDFFSYGSRKGLELLSDDLPRVDLVDDREEAGQFRLMPRQHLELNNQIITLLLVQKGKFIDFLAVASFLEFLNK